MDILPIHLSSQERLSASTARPGEQISMPCIRRRSPTPSRCPSPAHHDEASSPARPTTQRPESSVSIASTSTLAGSPATPGLQFPAILGAPFTAEPQQLTADPGSTVAEKPRRVWLAPTPVSFISGLRYTRRTKIDPKGDYIGEIGAKNYVQSSEPRSVRLGSGWKPFVHPEGSLYFAFKNFYTNVYLYDSDNLRNIETLVGMVLEDLGRHPDLSVEDIEIGLDLHIDEEDDLLGCYYCCNNKTTEAFWLSECSPAFFFDGENVKITGRAHLSLAAQAAYWDHVYMFPHGRELRESEIEELQADLCYYMFDKETSKTSTSPYSADDLHRFVQILKEIDSKHGGTGRPQHFAIIGRMKNLLLREHFIRYHGEPFAQLDSDYCLYEGNQQSRSVWFQVFAWIFFFTPQVYIERLNKVWVNNMVNYQNWRKFIGELQDDWTASITPSAVILTANVGFLAIQSVDQNGQAVPYRSAGQIVSYMSTFLSIGNIIACTILARQHRPSTHHYSEDAVAYLTPRTRTPRGMEKLAVIFSIPTAFFLWALLTFFIAISWVCLHHTDVITRVMSSVAIVVAAVLLGGVVHNGDWQPPESTNSGSTKMRRLGKLVKKVKQAPRRFTKTLRSMSMSVFPKRGRTSAGSTPGTLVAEPEGIVAGPGSPQSYFTGPRSSSPDELV